MLPTEIPASSKNELENIQDGGSYSFGYKNSFVCLIRFVHLFFLIQEIDIIYVHDDLVSI